MSMARTEMEGLPLNSHARLCTPAEATEKKTQFARHVTLAAAPALPKTARNPVMSRGNKGVSCAVGAGRGPESVENVPCVHKFTASDRYRCPSSPESESAK
jgi:hypothetical protein